LLLFLSYLNDETGLVAVGTGSRGSLTMLTGEANPFDAMGEETVEGSVGWLFNLAIRLRLCDWNLLSG